MEGAIVRDSMRKTRQQLLVAILAGAIVIQPLAAWFMLENRDVPSGVLVREPVVAALLSTISLISVAAVWWLGRALLRRNWSPGRNFAVATFSFTFNGTLTLVWIWAILLSH